jgi:F-box protein 21
VALCDPLHASIPIISVAIYCCIAQRLGLDAQPCGFPGHVLAIIAAPADETLDGEASGSTNRDVMYLDPFTDANEISTAQLRSQLSDMGATPAMMAGLLKPTTTSEIVVRAANNIANLPRHDAQTVRSHGFSQVLLEMAPEAQAFHGLKSDEASGLTTVLHRPRSLYAAAWAQLLVQPVDSRLQQVNFLGGLGERLNSFLHTFEPDYRIDMPLVTLYVMPLFPTATGEGLVHSGQSFLQDFVNHLEEKDSTPPRPSPRLGVPDAEKIKYRIGQIFHHHRFNYLAAITGWDMQCEASAEWIEQMHVDRLAHGRSQCFYHVVVEDQSTRYVAQENIDLVYSNSNGGYVDAPVEMPPALAHIAGKWFKRWDKNRGRFISNLEEEYPDD